MTDDFQTVATFTSPWDAHIAKGRLEAEGVPVFIAHEHHIWAGWIYSQALGGVKVQVPASRAVEAEAIIAEHLAGAFEQYLPDEAAPEAANGCPRCGSGEVRDRVPWQSVAALVLSLGILSIIWPARREQHACADCGFEWQE